MVPRFPAKISGLKPRLRHGVKAGMNAIPSPLVSRNFFAPSRVILAGLAVAALLAVPALQADVRVGVSLGFELPHGYAEVRVGHDRYYTHRGVFYQHGPHGYVVVRAPRGAFLRTLPPYCTRIYVGSAVYYRYAMSITSRRGMATSWWKPR